LQTLITEYLKAIHQFQTSVIRFSSFLFLWITLYASAQDSISTTLPNYKARKIALGASAAVLTSSSLVYLHQAWYKDYNTGSFHFFNDNKEWFGMDKIGHSFTTYQTSRLMMNAFEWSGFQRKAQLWIGGTIGFMYMSAVECMDGYSRGWGFSWGDMGANALGSSLAISQKVIWNEQRIQLKFSYFTSGLAKYNTRLLGSSSHEQILKDYNGQTHWLTISPYAFLNKTSRFPKWLNVALGYGGQNMINARGDGIILNTDGTYIYFKARRQYYLSFDIQLSHIKTKSVFLKRLLSVVSILKIPAPALELSNGKLVAHPIHF
jgi:hypothetical protein